jgi:hypothetical protein
MGFIQLQFRKGTSTEWTSANPVLANGEIGVELDTGLFKIGSASVAWNSLGYSKTAWTSLINIPTGIVSSSTQLPIGIVSSSTQVNYSQLQNIPTGIFSSSVQVNYSELQNIPPGLISSSTQVTYTGLQNIPVGLISQSAQVDVRNTTGISTIATTGSNTFTGVQTINNTTNSTDNNTGALIVYGGVGISKDVNISGSLRVNGLLSAVSTSFQYVTSSVLNVGLSKIILNSDDSVRFAGISIVDSGSLSATASLFYDSLTNDWVFEKTSTEESNSGSILLFGPLSPGITNTKKLVPNFILKAENNDHGHHVTASSIFDDGTIVKVGTNAAITGSLIVTNGITGSISGTLAGTFPYNSLIDPPAGIVSSSTQAISWTVLSSSFAQSASYAPVFPYVGDAEITGSLAIQGNVTAINGTFTKFTAQNDSFVTGSLMTTNAAVWVGSDSSHEVAIMIAGTPAFKVDTTSNFIPVTNGLQDIGSLTGQIRTLWVTNISSSTAIPSASYAETASYALSSPGGGSGGETFNPFLLVGM